MLLTVLLREITHANGNNLLFLFESEKNFKVYLRIILKNARYIPSAIQA